MQRHCCCCCCYYRCYGLMVNAFHSLDIGRLIDDERYCPKGSVPALHLGHGSFGLGWRWWG